MNALEVRHPAIDKGGVSKACAKALDQPPATHSIFISWDSVGKTDAAEEIKVHILNVGS